MVNSLGSYLLAITLLSQASGPPEESDVDGSHRVSSALSKGSYPWYDANKDAAKPINLGREPDVPSKSSPESASVSGVLGNLIALIGFGIALTLLLLLLIWLWRIYEPLNTEEAPRPARDPGLPSRIEELSTGMLDFDSTDPWAEAIRRRNRGDLAGAVICLFAHQLLTLSKLGLVRLAPGRTGRQLLRSVADSEFRGLVQPTLRQFESVYYGHRAPSAQEFADIWERAETFERRVAQGVVA